METFVDAGQCAPHSLSVSQRLLHTHQRLLVCIQVKHLPSRVHAICCLVTLLRNVKEVSAWGTGGNKGAKFSIADSVVSQ